jgi:hypothetical protein
VCEKSSSAPDSFQCGVKAADEDLRIKIEVEEGEGGVLVDLDFHEGN